MPLTAAEIQEVKTEMETHYFLLRRHSAWYFLGGAFGGALAVLAGIGFLTYEKAIAKARVVAEEVVKTPASEAAMQRIQKVDQEAAAALASIQGILKQVPDLPAKLDALRNEAVLKGSSIRLSGTKIQGELALPSDMIQRSTWRITAAK